MDINEINELALNSTACIRTASNIGETIVTNICTSEIVSVPWGSADMLSFYGLSAIIGLTIIMAFGLLASIIYETFGGY